MPANDCDWTLRILPFASLVDDYYMYPSRHLSAREEQRRTSRVNMVVKVLNHEAQKV